MSLYYVIINRLCRILRVGHGGESRFELDNLDERELPERLAHGERWKHLPFNP